MGNQPNKIENNGSITDRGAGLTATADVFDALAAIPKDMKDIVKYTSNEVKNIFKSATTKGKRYQRIGNTILSPFVAIGAAVEGALRTVVTPSVNFVKNAINSTFGSVFSKKPISNFKYEELKTANVIEKNENWFSKRRFSRELFQNYTQNGNKVSDTQQRNEKAGKNINSVEKNNNKKENKDDIQGAACGTAKNQRENEDSAEGTKKTDSKEENKENSKETTENVQDNSEHIGVAEAKRILSDSPCGKIIIDRLCKNHKDFRIIFNNERSDGECGYDHEITIGTKIPNNIKELAPFNWETKNPKTQIKHLLLHELSHGVIHSHAQEIPGIQEGLDLIKQYIKARKNIDGRTLSLLSYRSDRTYETTWKKAREDFVEMLALRMNGNGSLCKKYLKLLSDDEHKSFRESHGLVTITKEHASKLQNIFDSIIRYYENLSN